MEQVENSARMADIFHEVEDDLRRERLHAAWDKYGIVVLVLIVLIIGGTIGWLVYDKHRQDVAAEAGDRFYAALKLAEAGDHTGAAKAFADLAASAPVGYVVLASFQDAAQTLTAGDVTGAVARFDAIAGNASVEPVLRDLARLRAATALVDGGDRAAISGRLAPLIAGAGPWASAAREVDALAAFRAGDLAAARTAYQTLYDAQTTAPDQAQRAAMMIALINGAIGLPGAPPVTAPPPSATVPSVPMIPSVPLPAGDSPAAPAATFEAPSAVPPTDGPAAPSAGDTPAAAPASEAPAEAPAAAAPVEAPAAAPVDAPAAVAPADAPAASAAPAASTPAPAPATPAPATEESTQ